MTTLLRPSGLGSAAALALAATLVSCQVNVQQHDVGAEPSDASSPTDTKAEPDGDVEQAQTGERIFVSRCYRCHSIGQGDLVGPDLAGVHLRRSRSWLVDWLEDPAAMVENDPAAQAMFTEYGTLMPDPDLTRTQIDAVLDYIITRSEDGGIDELDLEELDVADAIGGRSVAEFVTSECGGCHHPRRTGATGPNITRQRLLDGTDALDPIPLGAALATIKTGRPGTSMPAWSATDNPTMRALSEEEINAVAKYLYTTDAPARFEFGLDDVRQSLEVLVEPSALPSTPTHDHRVDDLLLVTEREAFRVAVLDGDTLEIAGRMPSGARAHGYTFHPDGRFAYNLGRDGWLYKYDLFSLEPTRKVRVGLDARGIAISDDGKFVITGMYVPAQAVIVDAETLEPLELIDTHGVQQIGGGTVDSRIASVNDVSPTVGPYFLIALKEAGQVWRVDYSKPDFPITKVGDVGEILHDGFLRADNRVYFIASQLSDHMAAIDVETMELVGTIATGSKPHPGPGATWRADGTEYAATPHIGEGKNVIWEPHNLTIAGEVESGAPGLFVRTTPKMKYVWFDSIFQPAMNEIVVHEKTAPFTVVRRILDGTQTLHPEPDADGDYVFVSDWQENVVRAYDDETLELVETIEGLETPTGIFSVSRIHEPEGH